MKSRPEYPEFIKALPLGNLPAPEIKAHLLTGALAQAVFFDLPAGASVPPHSHGEQWGVVVAGELELTIGDETRIRRPGDSYFIDKGVEHSATVLQDALVVEVFADPNRYAPKG